MAKHSREISLVFLILLLNVALCCEITESNGLIVSTTKLKSDILKNYDKYAYPAKNELDKVEIQITVVVQDYYISNNYDPGNIHLTAEFTLSWNDTCLQWKPEDYNRIPEIEINTEDIWAPELKPTELDLFSNIPSILEDIECKLKYSGIVTCTAEVSHMGYCESDLFKWPYDIHACYVQYMISTKNNEDVTVTIPTDTGIQIDAEIEGYKVLKTSVDMYAIKAKRDINTHEIFFYIEVQQDLDAWVQFFYISIFYMTSLNLNCFWISINDLDRLFLLLMNIIFHFFEIQNMEWKIPSIGHTIPYIIVFYRNSLICTFVILLETLYFKSLLKSEKAEPNYISIFDRAVNKPIIKRILLIPINQEEYIPNEIDIKYIEEIKHLAKLQKLQILDRIIFILFCVVYFIMISVFFAI